MAQLHVFDLEKKALPKLGAMVVAYGKESFLQGLALRRVLQSTTTSDDPISATMLDADARWADVLDELGSRSLFGGGRPSSVVVRSADPFVTANRSELEQYVDRPKAGMLVLLVDTFPSNTKLAKRVADVGLAIDCRPPIQGKGPALDAKKVVPWLQARAEQEHGFKIAAAAARELVEISEPHFGVLDQDLAKLALYASQSKAVAAEMVRDVVGGWKKQTVWDLIDAVADGNAQAALLQLDRLLQSGEPPQALFGQLAWGLRRYATAANIYETAERRGKKTTVDQALRDAGFQRDLPRAKAQLMRITRARAKRLHGWLLETDLALKGSHSQVDRARAALELLLLKLATD